MVKNGATYPIQARDHQEYTTPPGLDDVIPVGWIRYFRPSTAVFSTRGWLEGPPPRLKLLGEICVGHDEGPLVRAAVLEPVDILLRPGSERQDVPARILKVGPDLLTSERGHASRPNEVELSGEGGLEGLQKLLRAVRVDECLHRRGFGGCLHPSRSSCWLSCGRGRSSQQNFDHSLRLRLRPRLRSSVCIRCAYLVCEFTRRLLTRRLLARR